MHIYNYLALGDSYTIGEAVPLHENFPYQLMLNLRKSGVHVQAPEIIAKTGWTTDELQAAMQDYPFLSKYDFVTLLIGVNNQYRGKNVIEYKEQLEELIKKSIELAHGKKDHVFIISIPDYGVTPFAEKHDPKKIESEVEVFNTINKALSIQYKVHYLDITPGSRKAKDDPSLVASDGLHPSGKEYARWAKLLTEVMSAQLK